MTPMPFSKYLTNDGGTPANSVDDPPFSHEIQLQVPSFVYTSVPTLAPGGGAEVVTFNPSWFTSNDDEFPKQTYGIPTSLLQPPHSFRSHSPSLTASFPIVLPRPRGLPVYSASGLDLLSILARVATRPNPSIALGPVDLTCSFVVVDVRRHDHPIVYCSPSFCRLTGYSEGEILGRNCRFLQAPGGAVSRGSPRRFTSQQNVASMHKALSADKEVQTTLVNYRKDGTAFINLVSVIPVLGGVSGGPEEANDIVWHIGFQVDLAEQPGIILDRLRDGTYLHDQRHTTRWNHQLHLPGGGSLVKSEIYDKKKNLVSLPPLKMSDTLKSLLRSDLPPFNLLATASGAMASTALSADPSHALSLLLLSHTPDFIHVVSLKGAFLYVAPAVTRVLGYAPSDLLGCSMADLAHPEDVVPLERQLKEASIIVSPAGDFDVPSDSHHISTSFNVLTSPAQGQPRPVDIVFRARTKCDRFVWLECRGRLHVEPGKGRKAIILSGRSREIGNVLWGDVSAMSPSIVTTSVSIEGDVDGDRAAENAAEEKFKGKKQKVSNRDSESSSSSPSEKPDCQPVRKLRVHIQPTEFWAMLGGLGWGAGALLTISNGVDSILGWSKDVLIGRRLSDLVFGETARAAVDDTLVGWEEKNRERSQELGGALLLSTSTSGGAVQTLRCTMKTCGGGSVRVLLVLYRSSRRGTESELGEERRCGVAPAPTILQVQLDSDPSPNLSRDPSIMDVPSLPWPPPLSSFGVSSERSNYPKVPTPVASLTMSVDPLLTHLPTDNIFAELEAESGSSWQYELQQLKFANQRLEEGIREYEEILRGGEGDLDVGGLVTGEAAVDACQRLMATNGLGRGEMNDDNTPHSGPAAGFTSFHGSTSHHVSHLTDYGRGLQGNGATNSGYDYVDSAGGSVYQDLPRADATYRVGNANHVGARRSFNPGMGAGAESYDANEDYGGDRPGLYQEQNRQAYHALQRYESQQQQYQGHYEPDHTGRSQLPRPLPPPQPQQQQQRLYAPVPVSADMQSRRSSFIEGHVRGGTYGLQERHFLHQQQPLRPMWDSIPPSISRRGVKRPFSLVG